MDAQDTDTKVTRVVFRKWKSDGAILALFPDQTWFEGRNNAPRMCSSYEHVGQHGGADYYGCIHQTWPAFENEYAELKKELEDLGYKLKPITRWSRREDA